MSEKRSQRLHTSPITMAGKTSALGYSDIFRHLDAEEISELERITSVMVVPPGRVLYRPGDASAGLFLLKAGHIQLYHLSTDGRKLITATLEAGTCFGLISFAEQKAHTCFAEAVTEAQFYVFNKHDIEYLLIHKPMVMRTLLELMSQRLTQLEAQLIDTAFKSTSARLATLLLQLADEQSSDETALVVAGLSHEELADRLGVYRETVSNALRELKDAGAIELGRRHITINDTALLESLASANGKSGRSTL